MKRLLLVFLSIFLTIDASAFYYKLIKESSEWAFPKKLSAQVHANINARVACEKEYGGRVFSSLKQKCRMDRRRLWVCETRYVCKILEKGDHSST